MNRRIKKIILILLLSTVCLFVVMPAALSIYTRNQLINKTPLEQTCYQMALNNYRDNYPIGITHQGIFIVSIININEGGVVPYKIKYIGYTFFGFPNGTFEYNCNNYQFYQL